jgi:enoyl-CoA hydratase
MAYEYEKLKVEQDGMVVIAAINHPPANSMGQGVLRDIKDLLEKCEKDDGVRVIILTGSGEKLFCAGADITEFADLQKGRFPNTTATRSTSRSRSIRSHHCGHAGRRIRRRS